MSPDKIERTIEFILEHQANAAIRLEETDRQIRELAKSTNQFVASTKRFQEEMKGHMKVLVSILKIQSKRLDRLEGLS